MGTTAMELGVSEGDVFTSMATVASEPRARMPSREPVTSRRERKAPGGQKRWPVQR